MPVGMAKPVRIFSGNGFSARRWNEKYKDKRGGEEDKLKIGIEEKAFLFLTIHVPVAVVEKIFRFLPG